MNTSTYTVERHPHGAAIIGSLPVSAIDEVVEIGAVLGCTHVDTRLSGMLSARWGRDVVMVLVSETSGDEWVAELEAEPKPEGRELDPLLEFVAGPHCGISAQTIIWVLHGLPGRSVRSDRQGSPPWDPADLVRCLRLLRVKPEWRARLGEVADRVPRWRPLVDHWDELVGLLNEEAPDAFEGKGSAPRTYARMCELLHPGVSR